MGNMKLDFTGSSVVVTGAARGIGLAIGGAFVGWGAQVALVDRDVDEVRAAADRTGARSFVADVANTSDVQGVVDAVVRDHGSVDILVNNAGVLRDNVVWKLSDEEWESVLAVHAGGTFRFTRAVVPSMRKAGRGRIINVTSYSGLRGNTGQANYSAAKAGVIGFTKTTAKELARFGITVNAISPNASTRMVESIPDAKKAEIAAAIPLGRFSEPEEVSPAVGFLASEEASYVTGVVLPVDGGVSI